MKILEYKKCENEITVRLLGFDIMIERSDYAAYNRTQSFLGGLVKTVKLNDPYQEHSKKDIKILGLSIIRRIEENNYRDYYLFNRKVYSVSLMQVFKRKYFKYFDKQYDDIYILYANSGEIYLILTYIINSLLKRNNSKKPLLAATKKYHINMIKMICPDIPHIYIGGFDVKITGGSFKIDDFRFLILFSKAKLKTAEMNIKKDNKAEHHYFKSILNRLNMTEQDIEMNKIKLLPEIENSMLEKVSKTGLNLDRFVFLAPEALSCKLYDEDFWCLLINKLQDKGYDVFVNLAKNDIKLKGAVDYKKCGLSYAEAFALAKRAKKIVSLRSGFTEFLLQTGVSMDVLYTKFRLRNFFEDMDIYHVISGFALSKLPFVDKTKIREFNMFEVSQKECLDEILDGLSGTSAVNSENTADIPQNTKSEKQTLLEAE